MQIQSSQLSISISPKGAELTSIKNKNGTEYLWQAKPEIWPRHAPVLFPIVGKLKNNAFSFAENSYTLSQHGFARDMQFETLSIKENLAHFHLTSGEQSKKNYPFDFELNILYTLTENKLVTTYKIVNPSSVGTLFFSIGAHPGFCCPFFPGEKFADYYIEFEKTSYEISLLEDGLRSGKKEQITLPGNQLPLSGELFDNDALVFENNQVDTLSLCSRQYGKIITMNCNNWPSFGIWSKKGCREFLCLEPWYGIADHLNHNAVFQNKDGILKLEPGRSFECSFDLIFTGPGH